MKHKRPRTYWEGNRREVVIVLPRDVQLQCQHEWRRRVLEEHSSGWQWICRKCGSCCR
jgi:hypothetical protein